MSNTIKQNDKVFKLACFALPRLRHQLSTDSCEIRIALFMAVIKALVLSVASAFAFFFFVIQPVVAICETVIWVCNGYHYVFSTIAKNGFGLMIACLLLVLIGLISWGWSTYNETKSDRPPKTPGLLKTTYQGWKDKFCVNYDIERIPNQWYKDED